MKRLLSRLTLTSILLAPAARAAAPDLATSPSAFIRMQAHSLVNWETWNAKVLDRARTEDKPVYVFIGSLLSELSRATCQQSFTNAETAAYLNQHFICVIVDREEQPDVAACARFYLQTLKQKEGWPAHLWLTPELQPYDGATYLPPSEEWGGSSFTMVARQAGNAWAGNPKACRGHASEAVSMMAAPASDALSKTPPTGLSEKLAQAAAAWRATFDSSHGGFGTAAKSPEPELLRFLLRQSPADREAALTTLRALLNGALHDPIDGGFFRRTVDAAWHVPYLQKTLSDQARLALACLDAAQVTGDAAQVGGARSALDYALQRLGTPDGGFAAAEDATSNEFLGYYVWTEAEIDALLGPDAAAFKSAYGVESGGNVSADDDPAGLFRGKNFLFRSAPPGAAAAEGKHADALRRLRVAREKRPPPARDDHATAGAHGLMLAALARAGAQLNDAGYRAAAARTFDVVAKQLVVSADGEVRRLRGSAAPGAPADYAALALGCREFAKAAKRADAEALANRLMARAGSVFFDAAQGTYLASAATLPIGVFVRAPAAGDPPSADSLALMAGAPPEQAAALTKTLAASLNEGDTVPGDVLLALQH
jgi:uncharacterized protein YyaL (SSP411 family)